MAHRLPLVEGLGARARDRVRGACGAGWRVWHGGAWVCSVVHMCSALGVREGACYFHHQVVGAVAQETA